MAAHRSGHDALMTTVYRGLLAATLIVVGIASHLGATLTHGEGYLTEHAPSAMQRWFGLSGSSLASGVTRPDQAVAYSTLVQPILDRRCVSCHGPITAEGKLRLDTLEGIRKGGGDGPVIVPGRASESEIVRRIWLPPSHKHAMPPGGRNYLPPAEAAVIRWWIDQGATGDAKLGELDISADVLPAIEAVVGPVMRGGPSLPDVNVPLADRQAVAAANRLGVSVVPLASGNHFVEVHCTNAGARFGDTELAAIRPLAPQTVWLDLSGTCITDAGLATVAGFRNLTRLHLNHTRVSDDGLKQLVSLQHLEYLNLYGTAVTDAGLQVARAPPEAAHPLCVADCRQRKWAGAAENGTPPPRGPGRPGARIAPASRCGTHPRVRRRNAVTCSIDSARRSPAGDLVVPGSKCRVPGWVPRSRCVPCSGFPLGSRFRVPTCPRCRASRRCR